MRDFKKICLSIYVILAAGIIFSPNVNSYNDVSHVSIHAIPQIKTGDLVTRKGKGLISHVFAKLSDTQKMYSHIGIIWIIDNEPFVLHMIGHSNKLASNLRLDPLDYFLDKERASLYSFYRMDLEQHEREILPNVFQKTIEMNIEFDDKFDLNTLDAMYCTELIRYCLTLTTNNRDFFPTESRKGQQYITIGNIISKAKEL